MESNDQRVDFRQTESVFNQLRFEPGLLSPYFHYIEVYGAIGTRIDSHSITIIRGQVIESTLSSIQKDTF